MIQALAVAGAKTDRPDGILAAIRAIAEGEVRPRAPTIDSAPRRA